MTWMVPIRGPNSSRIERGAQRGGHAVHLPLRHIREEGQRERARRHVLTHRKLALPMAEALSVDRHQVNRGQVGLALDAARGAGPDDRLAVDPARAPDHESETD